MEAIASVLSSGSENLNQVVIWKVMEGKEPRNSLQVEMEGHDHGFTWGEQQMEAQRMTSSHLPFVNCLCLSRHIGASLFLFVCLLAF